MRLKPGVGERTRAAVQAFYEYATGCSGGAGRWVQQFCLARPSEAQILVEMYDAAHPRLNHLLARKLTRVETKVRVALEDAQESEGGWHGWGRWSRRHRLLLTVVTLVLILPVLLSPTHPIAVYGYLAASYDPSLLPEALAYSGTDLTSFLTSPAQVRRYKADLLEDMMDMRSGKLFVIVRCSDGALRQEAIRTWNGFLPDRLPSSLSTWLDRKELPYLGDKVDTWLRGNEIIAMGHYHAFGGPPSAGDRCAQYLSDLPEIVVVNGLVPMTYLDGKVVSYGDDVVVSEEIFRFLYALQPSLMMDLTRYFSFSEKPSPALRSFLGFLKDHRDVHISRRDSVAIGIGQLYVEFKDDYRTVFTEGFRRCAYENDLDKSYLLSCLYNIDNWIGYNFTVTQETRPRTESAEIGIQYEKR